MLRLTKLADYGIVLLIHFARSEEGAVLAARDLAERSRLPLPTVSRILKALVGGGILESHRGVKGGYSLARGAERVNVAEIVSAIEGPIGMTVCTESDGTDCEHEAWCPAVNRWQVINQAIHGALAKVTLAEMATPVVEPRLVEIEATAGRGSND
jgi:FeS assembly SUF system regulator